jgi:hypothetical protein
VSFCQELSSAGRNESEKQKLKNYARLGAVPHPLS